MILAANSSPVDFWTHRLTIENAPLQKRNGSFVSRRPDGHSISHRLGEGRGSTPLLILKPTIKTLTPLPEKSPKSFRVTQFVAAFCVYFPKQVFCGLPSVSGALLQPPFASNHPEIRLFSSLPFRTQSVIVASVSFSSEEKIGEFERSTNGRRDWLETGAVFCSALFCSEIAKVSLRRSLRVVNLN